MNVCSIGYGKLDYDLAHGGEVYTCELVRIEKQVSGGFERGMAFLRVTQTLHGRQRAQLQLAYVIPATWHMPISDYKPIWPRDFQTPGASLLCVVIPDAYNAAAEPTPDDDWNDFLQYERFELPRDDNGSEPVHHPANPDGAASRVTVLRPDDTSALREVNAAIAAASRTTRPR